MSKSIVVELWDRHSGVVGTYKVVLERSLWEAFVGNWRVRSAELIQASGEPGGAEIAKDAAPIVVEMTQHELTEMNGWLCRRL